MNNVILEAKNISKQYRLGLVGTGTLTHDLNRFWHRIRGKEDPYLQIGAVNDRKAEASSEYVWALKDINFEVKQGEILGIIGKNGAGKSTLLKILSRVTSPTTGSIKIKGRIASLLEVGTGMHPELTGRENIFLNGAILGMSKAEIKEKIDEIVEFSGCQMYIDTPVKRYSSGMRVRLGFAVAAFLEPDILVIDEVLAVGDAEFQKKAIGKMQDISSEGGRTVLFVSHNMAAVKNLCTRAIVLEHGQVVFEGETNTAVDYYLKSDTSIENSVFLNPEPNPKGDILEVKILDINSIMTNTFQYHSQIILKITGIIDDVRQNAAAISFKVKNSNEMVIFSSENFLSDIEIDSAGSFETYVYFPQETLLPNSYTVTIGFHIPNQEKIASLFDIVHFTIAETGTIFQQYKGVDFGCVHLDCVWKNNTIQPKS